MEIGNRELGYLFSEWNRVIGKKASHASRQYLNVLRVNDLVCDALESESVT